MENKLIIAIDGPGASGKSTVAKLVAKRLNLTYIDTGAMYRCLALYALRNNIDIKDSQALADAAKNINIFLSNDNKVFLNDEDVSSLIRGHEVTAIVSPVSAPRIVREILVEKQKELANNSTHGVIMDGRDIGTVVLPNANLKIYQIASSKVRAQRRYDENMAKGLREVPLAEIEKQINDRDYLDMHKGFGSLKKADDAYELDTTNLTIDEVVNWICDKAKEVC